MASQPAPARPWFRLPSIARPPPVPEPTPTQPRPVVARPPFRTVSQPTQPQEPTAPPPPPVVASPAAPAPPAVGVASTPSSPALRAASGVASVPTSPALRPSAPSSLPPSPVVPTSTVLPATASASVPTPPKAGVSAPTASLTSSPALKPAQAATSVPSSPTPKPMPTTSSALTSPARNVVTTTSTAPSPKTIKPAVETPPQSPKTRPIAPPPSPLALPPLLQVKSDTELEPKIPVVAEQKTVLVQKTIDKPRAGQEPSSIAALAKQELAKDVQTKEKIDRKKASSDYEDGGMRVITLAGENRGALMEVFHSPKKHLFEGNSHFLHKNGNLKSDDKGWKSQSSSSSSEEGNPKKEKSRRGKGVMSTSPLSAFANSNVQGVNNSIVFKSSCTHHDPGVHLALSRKPAGAGFQIKDHSNGHKN